MNNNRDRHNEGQRERYRRDLDTSRKQARESQARRRAKIKANLGQFIDDRCAYCGQPAETWDHVRPIAKGGADHPDNKVRACLGCNQEKCDADLLQFLLARAITS